MLCNVTWATLQQAAGDCGFILRQTGRDSGTYHRFRIFPTSDRQRKWSLCWHTRRVNAVCWHGHRDFMRAVFALEPSATFRTSVATWRGSVDFEARYQGTATRNVGSQMMPMPYASSCECSWWDI